MSYSRWSSSRWYTFWSSHSNKDLRYKLPTEKLKRSQMFEICDIPSYRITYGDLVDRSRASVLRDVKEHFSGNFEWSPLQYNEESGKLERGEKVFIKEHKSPTWDELRELQDYFARFLIDVDNYFKPWNFFIHEWYHPIKYKFYQKIKKMLWKNR